jgi:hypothetical protein
MIEDANLSLKWNVWLTSKVNRVEPRRVGVHFILYRILRPTICMQYSLTDTPRQRGPFVVVA